VNDPRSRIPSVDALVTSRDAAPLIEEFGRDRSVDAIRAAVDTIRARVSAAAAGGRLEEWDDRVEDVATYLGPAREALEVADVPSLRRVVNATGVVLHTNLGRAPLAEVAVEAMRAAARQYTNLEFDLESGTRGSRYAHCVSLLTELTGAEDALVVNNAAGALVLAVNTTARGAGIAVSRGELVEIGGGFRIPEVLERAGATLVEVGSTNRTRLGDYRTALMEQGAVAVLKVHRSNFRITGFTEEASIAELSEVAQGAGVPLVHDLGSGLMIDAEALGLPAEPRAMESVAAGADVVVVSGDKLLGGPQAGIIVGSAVWIAKMRKNPLCRALRVDKVTLAGLEATLRLYRRTEQALARIPTLRMLAEPAASVRARAESLAERLGVEGVSSTIVPTKGAIGGGTYPGVELDSWALELDGGSGAESLATALRGGDPPVIGRIVDDRVRLDARTVLPGQEGDLVRRVAESAARSLPQAEGLP